MYDEHSYRKPPRQPATAQAHWGETMAGKVTMERLGREETINIISDTFHLIIYEK
jgi:hypothetical protein